MKNDRDVVLAAVKQSGRQGNNTCVGRAGRKGGDRNFCKKRRLERD